MEREKGEYLDMDEDKRRELDEQAQEYVSDAPEMPSMNADPDAAPAPGDDPDGPDVTQRVES